MFFRLYVGTTCEGRNVLRCFDGEMTKVPGGFCRETVTKTH